MLVRCYVTAILWLQFMVHVMLFPMINILSFHISRPALRSMCVVSSMAVFYSYLISCFPDMFVTYFLNDERWLQLPLLFAGITFVFKLQMRCISMLRYLYFRNFPPAFLITLQALTVARCNNTHVVFSLSRIMVSSLLLGMVLLVLTCWFHNTVNLASWFVSPNFGTYSYQCSLSSFTSISFRMVKCLYLIIIIIIIIITFMQGIYTYIPETNYVPREYSVAAICCYYSWCLYR